MIKPIIKDILIFRKASPASVEDIQTAMDLKDTLSSNADICVGMAANMIGVNKAIIAFFTPMGIMTMLNPVITKKSKKAYTAEEGCLSLPGVRTAKRFQSITVEYQDLSFKKHTASFSGYTAQIIQHEIDHCNGIII